MERYFTVRTKQFADTLAFLGFRYFIIKEDGETAYNFENTEVFKECLEFMIKLRKEQKNKIKREKETENYENYES